MGRDEGRRGKRKKQGRKGDGKGVEGRGGERKNRRLLIFLLAMPLSISPHNV